MTKILNMQLKQFTKLVFVLALLMGAWQGQVIAQTYFGGGNPQPIPASGSGTATCSTATTSTAAVPISGTIGVDATLESQVKAALRQPPRAEGRGPRAEGRGPRSASRRPRLSVTHAHASRLLSLR